jgi:hypothetical protein
MKCNTYILKFEGIDRIVLHYALPSRIIKCSEIYSTVIYYVAFIIKCRVRALRDLCFYSMVEPIRGTTIILKVESGLLWASSSAWVWHCQAPT